MHSAERERFDALFEQVLADLPPSLHELIEQTPVILEDTPDPKLLAELGVERDGILCGLHTGIPLTERSVEHAFEPPEYIHLYRRGIIDVAGGWRAWVDRDGERHGGDDAIREQIRITLLHEIGHHFGMDEDDLEAYGYG